MEWNDRRTTINASTLGTGAWSVGKPHQDQRRHPPSAQMRAWWTPQAATLVRWPQTAASVQLILVTIIDERSPDHLMAMRLGVLTVKARRIHRTASGYREQSLDLFRRQRTRSCLLCPVVPRFAPPDAFFGRAFTLGPSLTAAFDEFPTLLRTPPSAAKARPATSAIIILPAAAVGSADQFCPGLSPHLIIQ
jgi:hypothetical protein